MNKTVTENKNSEDIKNSYDNMLEYLGVEKNRFIDWGIQEITKYLPNYQKVQNEWKNLKKRIKITKTERRKLEKEIKNLTQQIKDKSSTIYRYKKKNINIKQLERDLESLKPKKAQKKEILKSIYIRGYSQDKEKTWKNLKQIYKTAKFQCDIKRDTSNNGHPPILLERITSKTKTKSHESDKLKYIPGYKVSHMWGFTKNVYLFNCPWNIIYTPTAIDPFTGHELADSKLKQDMQKEIANLIFNKYGRFIQEYNNLLKTDPNIKKFKRKCQEKIKNLKQKITPKKEELAFYEDMLKQFQPLTKENIFLSEDSDNTDE